MLRYTTLLALHYTTPHHTQLHYTQLHYTTLPHPTLHYITLHYITLHYITLHYSTVHLHYITLHYNTLQYITIHSLHHHKCNCNCATLITLHHSYNSATLQLQLQLRYTTLHPAVVGEVTDQVTTATIAATPKKHSSNHLSVHQWICSAIRDSQQPISPIDVLCLKLPPPPCAVLLVAEVEGVSKQFGLRLNRNKCCYIL